MPNPEVLNRIGSPVRVKLVNMLGELEAARVTEEVLVELRLATVRSADDIYHFGSAILHRGGMFEVLGRSIQTQAILRGAKRL